MDKHGQAHGETLFVGRIGLGVLFGISRSCCFWDGARWFDLSFRSCILYFHNKAHESRCTLPELSLFPALLSRIGVVLFVRLCRNSWPRVLIAFQLPSFEFQQ